MESQRPRDLASLSRGNSVNHLGNASNRKAAARPPHSTLIAGVGVDGARAFHRFGQAAADRAEGEGRDIALWS